MDKRCFGWELSTKVGHFVDNGNAEQKNGNAVAEKW